MRREALAGSLGCLRRPALSPHLAIFCGKCAHGIMETLAHVPGRTVAPCAAKSSPDGCSANALDNQPAEPAGTAPEPPLVVAKCSVMMGGNWCRADGCLGAQDRNLAALGAAGAPSSRKFRLRRRPWHLCSKINPAIRQISPSSAHSTLVSFTPSEVVMLCAWNISCNLGLESPLAQTELRCWSTKRRRQRRRRWRRRRRQERCWGATEARVQPAEALRRRRRPSRPPPATAPVPPEGAVGGEGARPVQ